MLPARYCKAVSLNGATLLLGLLLGLPPTAAAQAPGDPPLVQPGELVTIAAPLPSLPCEGLARYTIQAAPGVRMLSPATGTVDWIDEDPWLPLTFNVGPTQEPGHLDAILVRLERAHCRDSVTLTVDVAPRYHLRLTLPDQPGMVAGGDTTSASYILSNRGNVADTVTLSATVGRGWTIEGTEEPVVVQPGADTVGRLRLQAPAEADGARHSLSLSATGLGSTERARTTFHVLAPSRGTRMVPLPITVFAGTAPGSPGHSDRTALSLEAGGRVTPTTSLSLRTHWAPLASTHTLPHRLVRPGTGYTAEIRRPDWSLAVGDLGMQNPLARLGRSGRGATVGFNRHGVNTEVTLARPLRYGGRVEDGHHALLQSTMNTGIGRLGVMLAEHVGQVGTGDESRIRTAGTSLSGYWADMHRLDADAGLVQVALRDGTSFAGPVLRARYNLHGTHGSLNARLSRVPASLPGTAAMNNETFLGGTAHLGHGLSLNARVSESWSEPLDEPDILRRQGGSVGLRYARDRLRLEGAANARRVSGLPFRIHTPETRSLSASASYHMGSFMLQARGEAGRGELAGEPGPLRNLRTTVRWRGYYGWASVGTYHVHNYYGPQPARGNLNAGLNFRHLEIQTNASARLDGTPLGDAVSFRTTLLSDWFGPTAVLATEYRPWIGDGSGWQAMIGIKHRFSILAPLGGAPAVRGVVFHDLDGDGARSPDDPPLSRVAVQSGQRLARTDERGRFAFHQAPREGDVFRVNLAPLGGNLLLHPGIQPEPGKFLEVPVVTAASLTLQVQMVASRNNNSTPDESNAGAVTQLVALGNNNSTLDIPGEGAVAQLVDEHGRIRQAQADADGIIVFRGLFPGRYEGIVRSGNQATPSATPVEFQVTLAPGQDLVKDISLLYAPREIRMQVMPPDTVTLPDSLIPPTIPDTLIARGLRTDPPAVAAEELTDPPAAAAEELLETVQFRFDSAVLGSAARQRLEALVEDYAASGAPALCITGHTDQHGVPEYNLHLARRRAEAVKQFLVEAGLDPESMYLATFGEHAPRDAGVSFDAHARNRRVEIRTCSPEEELERITETDPDGRGLWGRVHFAFDSAVLRHDRDRQMVLGVQPLLAAIPEARLCLAGHTDKQGDPGYNDILAQRRAETVRRLLLTAGVDAHQLRAAGYGARNLLHPGTDEEAHALNRRVELLLLPPGTSVTACPRIPDLEGSASSSSSSSSSSSDDGG